MADLNPPLIFKTYQDVKNNLTYWTIFLLIGISFLIYNYFLNPGQILKINEFVIRLGNNSFVATIAGLFLFGFYILISIVLIWFLQVHDCLYDRYIIRWREKYDIDFILKELTKPIISDLCPDFFLLAKKNKYEFMKPFYGFVGDGKKGITDNARIRFYERVTWYWVTQLNECFALLLLLTLIIFLMINQINPLVYVKYLVLLIGIFIFVIINRILAIYCRSITSQATSDEIEEILENKDNIRKLKEQYQSICNNAKNK